MTNNKEKRFLKIDDIDFHLRAVKSEDGVKRIIGYASVFEFKSKILKEWVVSEEGDYEFRTFYEVVNKGAFDTVLKKNGDVVLSVDHEFGKLLARTTSGTLKLTVDDKGLRYEATVPNTTLGNDVYEMVLRHDYFESSFMFTVESDEWEYDNNNDIWTRNIVEVKELYDCTVCSYRGAYNSTDIQVAQRSLDANIKKHNEENPDEQERVDEQENPDEQEERVDEKFMTDLDIFFLENDIN